MGQASFPSSTLLGVMQVAFALLTAPVSRLWYRRWGATDQECDRALPGDDLVPSPKLSYTRAISINGSAAEVWPWLVQLGQGRGGLYSYDGLENLVGCEIHSADRILQEHQDLKVGDHILFGPEAKKFPGQVVIEIQPERALIMYGLDPGTRKADPSASWAFVLEGEADGRTRLLVRGRNDYAPGFLSSFIWHIVEPIAFVMERKMLLGLKARVEDSHP